ncbi:UNVERIFIED_CONTAM: hypothetical protein Sindi_2589400, partial [Sesamum indicum]
EGSTLLKVEGTDRSADLSKIGKESAELDRELRALERQSSLSNQSAGSIDEALQLYKENDVHQMFQGILRNYEYLYFWDEISLMLLLKDKINEEPTVGCKVSRDGSQAQFLDKLSWSQPLELTTVASEFRVKLENLKRKKIEEIQCDRTDRLRVRHGDLLNMPHGNGNANGRLQNLCQMILREIN